MHIASCFSDLAEAGEPNEDYHGVWAVVRDITGWNRVLRGDHRLKLTSSEKVVAEEASYLEACSKADDLNTVEAVMEE